MGTRECCALVLLFFGAGCGDSTRSSARQGNTCDERPDGRCLELLTAVTPTLAVPYAAVIHSDFLYHDGPEGIARVPIDGGESQLWLADPWGASNGMRIDDGFVYWTHATGGSDPPTNGAVLRGPLAGGEGNAVVSEPPDYAPFDVDGSHVYWTDRTLGEVRRAAVDSFEPETLYASDEVRGGMEALDGFVYFYLWTPEGFVFVRIPRDGGSLETLWSGGETDIISGHAVHPTGLYIANDEAGELSVTPLDGGDATILTTWPTEGGSAVKLLVDDDAVYMGIVREGELLKIPLAGGEPETLHTGSQVIPLATDDDSLYFSAISGSGGIYRLTPK